MLKKVFRNVFGVTRTQYRALCSQDGSNLKDKDIIGEELAEALDNVTNDICKNDPVEKKKTRLSILSRLTESAKETFNTAVGHETVEILYDKEIAGLLGSLDVKPELKPLNKFAEVRKDTRAIVALRKEIFYLAHQSGKSHEEARLLAENSVAKAEEKLRERREAKLKGGEEEKAVLEQIQKETNAKEGKFFKMAFEWMEKNLYSEQNLGDLSESLPPKVDVNPSVPNIFEQTSLKLDIFKDTKSFEERSLNFWREWNLKEANLVCKGVGPRNIFEKHIEWTKQGKLWPYPINNEYELGEELEVGFHEHIFLQKYLSKYNLPKTGSIAHFMELVCVGLSKNPYMTAAKKREHLDWFGKFFDSKRQKTIENMHEKERLAATDSI
ncbi:28S ribosomal protein S31, mitochondrial [Strongyloides ratti]|uniref:Small ribosomal subunit protein mS31 n=1 Tax=Strongyloides ratti TaxID=34506 RepID=A0A090MYY4_STRRB|nr:28S ribosomal protein S31, mitochondrial [Strongyloides ratti]CEF67989.1 28S ribosomal protein S31, mitochondrial [Strongyloides ratti]